jgi:hypothetical protein
MDMFHVVVLTIAIVLLIAVLTFFGIVLTRKTTNSMAFPPVYNTCPNFWAISADGSSCIVPNPANSLNTGILVANNIPSTILQATPGYKTYYDVSNAMNVYTVNFNDAGWTNGGGVCAWKNWALQTNVVWDGVDNYNSC